MTYPDPPEPKWYGRARQVGFRVYRGKPLAEMNGADIEAALEALYREYEISYVWCNT